MVTVYWNIPSHNGYDCIAGIASCAEAKSPEVTKIGNSPLRGTLPPAGEKKRSSQEKRNFFYGFARISLALQSAFKHLPSVRSPSDRILFLTRSFPSNSFFNFLSPDFINNPSLCAEHICILVKSAVNAIEHNVKKFIILSRLDTLTDRLGVLLRFPNSPTLLTRLAFCAYISLRAVPLVAVHNFLLHLNKDCGLFISLCQYHYPLCFPHIDKYNL